MDFVRFDETTFETVISSQGDTLPCMNYLGNKDFFSVINDTCRGYSFYKNSETHRLTRYDIDDDGQSRNGHFFYINDGKTIWSPTCMPCETPLDEYECRHGFGYSEFIGSKNGLASDLLVFVPIDAACEIRSLKLTNNTNEMKSFRLFSYLEMSRYDFAEDNADPNSLADAEIEMIGSVIFNRTGYGPNRNFFAFSTVNDLADTYDANRDIFIGPDGSRKLPNCVANGTCFESLKPGKFPAAAHCFHVDLEPGETRSFIFLLGYVENPEDDLWDAPNSLNKLNAGELIARFRYEEEVEKSFIELCKYWRMLLGISNKAPKGETPDQLTIRISKTWNQYRNILLANMKQSPENR